MLDRDPLKIHESERIDYPVKVQIAVALAALLAVWGVLQYAAFEQSYQQENRDPYKIDAQALRFEGLIAALPNNAVLGYLTDAAPGRVVNDAMFNGAQYALAPRLLQRGTGYDLVLGNFTKPSDFAAFGQEHRLRLERDFGNGVVLFRREAK